MNQELIPNYADVFEGLKDQPHNTVDGRVVRCSARPRRRTCSMWNTEEVPAETDELDVVWEHRLAGRPGKLSIYDAPIYIADAAVYLMATQPDLGSTNPYELDEDAVQRRRRALEAAGADGRRVLVGRSRDADPSRSRAETSTAGTTWRT